MLKKHPTIIWFFMFLIILSSCNLPARRISQTQTPISTSVPLPAATPTPVYLCNNQYFPSILGNTWQYSGSNTASGAYSRTDTVTGSSAEVFSVSTTISDVAYSVNYGCSSAGLTADNPIQQYAGALLSSPNAPVTVKITSNSGISLPAKITPGDTWQQSADFEAKSQDVNVNGRFVFDYTAVGNETVTVPFGTFNALRIDTTIRIEVTSFKVLAGTYTLSTWLEPDIGMIKSEGISHVPGFDFTDALQLTGFTTSP